MNMKAGLVVAISVLTVAQGMCQDQSTKLALGISYVPAVNWLSLSNEVRISRVFKLEPRFSHSFGIAAQYRITPRLSTLTGIYQMDYGYNFDVVDVDFPAPLAYPTGQYKARVTYLDVPIQLRLIIVESNRSKLYIKGGGAISWLQNRKTMFHPDTGAKEENGPRLLTLAKTLYSLRFGVGSLIPITKRLQADIYPNMRRTISTYNERNKILTSNGEKVHLYALALDITLWYNF